MRFCQTLCSVIIIAKHFLVKNIFNQRDEAQTALKAIPVLQLLSSSWKLEKHFCWLSGQQTR